MLSAGYQSRIELITPPRWFCGASFTLLHPYFVRSLRSLRDFTPFPCLPAFPPSASNRGLCFVVVVRGSDSSQLSLCRFGGLVGGGRRLALGLPPRGRALGFAPAGFLLLWLSLFLVFGYGARHPSPHPLAPSGLVSAVLLPRFAPRASPLRSAPPPHSHPSPLSRGALYSLFTTPNLTPRRWFCYNRSKGIATSGDPENSPGKE